ncbi:MAG: enoyl-CoA hydratase-related protein [Thermodesulfobacteriota bacterium]
MGAENFLLRKEPPIGFLGINRPKVKNAMSLEMWRAFPSLVAELHHDPAIRVIVLHGCEGNFTSGHDISELLQMGNAQGAEIFQTSIEGSIRAIEMAPIPVVAMIDGYALGSGYFLALGCDLRVASDRAVLGLPVGRLGIMFGTVLTRRLVLQMGLARTSELLLTGRLLKAGEAKDMGLVNQVYPAGKLLEMTTELVGQIARNAPLTVWAAKQTLQKCRPGWTAPWEIEEEPFLKCFTSSDFQEGIRAFLEKRSAKFKGR